MFTKISNLKYLLYSSNYFNQTIMPMGGNDGIHNETESNSYCNNKILDGNSIKNKSTCGIKIFIEYNIIIIK